MARYIDAEKCPCKVCGITYCNENCKKYYAWLEGCDYDVEAVVAELEASAEGAKDSKDLSKWSAYQKAISIVRGKEQGMEKDIYETVYTVDDEEPNCGRCDNINVPCSWCSENCGAEHGWYGYKRTETERSNHERSV